MTSMLLVGDIVEKEAPAKPVPFDDFDAAPTGFPAHKKRTRVSAFKQQRQGKPVSGAQAATSALAANASEKKAADDGSGSSSKADFEATERRRIDRENRQKLDDMSPEEIARQQRELLDTLDPSLIQRLLGRANIDEQHGPSPFDPPAAAGGEPKADNRPSAPAPEIKIEDTSAAPKPQPAPPKAATPKEAKTVPAPVDEDKAPAAPPADLFPMDQQPDKTHFPTPPALPDLDPSHPDFLATLHEKFFPNLPADPSKLAWMAPIPTAHSPADRESPYYPGQSSLPIAALRFDFRGGLIPPRLSRSIPVSKGLHHHGQAPEAAGYTVEELSILARSAVPAQRCVAFQTIGRILYRLGKGEWGTGEEDSLARGIWSSVQEGRVLDSLAEAAIVEGGHRGSRAYATEALWLFEKGGWREQWSGR